MLRTIDHARELECVVGRALSCLCDVYSDILTSNVFPFSNFHDLVNSNNAILRTQNFPLWDLSERLGNFPTGEHAVFTQLSCKFSLGVYGHILLCP